MLLPLSDGGSSPMLLRCRHASKLALLLPRLRIITLDCCLIAAAAVEHHTNHKHPRRCTAHGPVFGQSTNSSSSSSHEIITSLPLSNQPTNQPVSRQQLPNERPPHRKKGSLCPGLPSDHKFTPFENTFSHLSPAVIHLPQSPIDARDFRPTDVARFGAGSGPDYA